MDSVLRAVFGMDLAAGLAGISSGVVLSSAGWSRRATGHGACCSYQESGQSG
jgi:hypothetical protein